MYLTTGASSTSESSSGRGSRPGLLEVDLHVAEVGHVLEVDAGRVHELPDRGAELVILDHRGSATRLVLKRTSSSACRLAGSETATNRRLPRFRERQYPSRGGYLRVEEFLLDLVQVERREVEQRHANARDANSASCAALIRIFLKELLREGDARGGRLGLHRVRVGFRHETLLREGGGETAQIARWRRGWHGSERGAVPSGHAGTFWTPESSIIMPVGPWLFIRIKLLIMMMPVTWVCKGDGRPPTGAAGAPRARPRSWRLDDLHPLPGELDR